MDNELKDKEAENIVAQIQLNRIKNLLGLIGTQKISEFSNDHGLNEAYVSQLKNASRNFGEKAARKIEVYLGLPIGSLDIDPDKSLSELDEEAYVESVIAAQDELSQASKMTLLREISKRI
jgi:hypothetical protein